MSGFAGIIRLGTGSETSELDRPLMESMARAIAFRGPDALQQTSMPGAAFAFSLLRTGPSGQESAQPCTLDGETWFIGDARCDGRAELQERLGQRDGQTPASATSEQLVLLAFAQFGAQGLPLLDGDFSFALWNQRQRQLLAYRDLTGCRPFFYAQHGDLLLFSNTLQAVLVDKWVPRDLDEEFVADFLLGSPYHDASRTAYRHIRRLPPGHLLRFAANRLCVRRIANTAVRDLLLLGREEEYVEEFKRLLAESVKDRLPSGGTSILLSAGLDSTSVAACAVSLRKQTSPDSNLNLYALSVDSRPAVDDDEADLACRFAGDLRLPCDVVHAGDALPFAGWENLPTPFPEPVVDPYSDSYLSNYRLLSTRSRVVLTGNGGDEVLRLQAWPYLKFVQQRHGTVEAIATLARYLISEHKLPPLGAGIRSAFVGLFNARSEDSCYPPWFEPDFAARMKLPERWKAMKTRPQPLHPFNPKAYASLNDLTVASMMEFLDATWTGCALEPRHPFLDRRLSRFLLRLPLIPWAMDKYLLRRSQIGILPDQIRLRVKTPVLQDLLPLHVTSGKFCPSERAGHAGSFLARFVNWPILVRALSNCTDLTLYLHLRPLALRFWLVNLDGQR